MHVWNLFLIGLIEFQEIISVFMRKVLPQKKICNTKNPGGLFHSRKSKNHAVRKRINFQNGPRTVHVSLRILRPA